jgi:hypothetical protein
VNRLWRIFRLVTPFRFAKRQPMFRFQFDHGLLVKKCELIWRFEFTAWKVFSPAPPTCSLAHQKRGWDTPSLGKRQDWQGSRIYPLKVVGRNIFVTDFVQIHNLPLIMILCSRHKKIWTK